MVWGAAALQKPSSHRLALNQTQADKTDMIWEFPKIGIPYIGVIIIRILPFRVLYYIKVTGTVPLIGLAQRCKCVIYGSETIV